MSLHPLSTEGMARYLALRREAQVAEVSLTDPLTGVGNRRRLEQALATEISRSRRAGSPLCAVMADLDYLKAVNDQHGHAAGDLVLERFAQILRTHRFAARPCGRGALPREGKRAQPDRARGSLTAFSQTRRRAFVQET